MLLDTRLIEGSPALFAVPVGDLGDDLIYCYTFTARAAGIRYKYGRCCRRTDLDAAPRCIIELTQEEFGGLQDLQRFDALQAAIIPEGGNTV